MKKRSALTLMALVVGISLLVGSCATTFKAGNGKLSYGSISGTSKGHFENKANAISIFSPYLFPITKPNEKLDELIEPELAAKGANAAENIQVRYGFDLLGLLISSITGGVLNWGYVSVSGNAISR